MTSRFAQRFGALGAPRLLAEGGQDLTYTDPDGSHTATAMVGIVGGVRRMDEDDEGGRDWVSTRSIIVDKDDLSSVAVDGYFTFGGDNWYVSHEESSTETLLRVAVGIRRASEVTGEGYRG